MLNIEKYKGEIKNYIENGDDLQDGICSIYYNANHHGTDYQGVLDWLCEEYQEPILDEEERKYLSAVIKPFRKDITTIEKKHFATNWCFIVVNLKNKDAIVFPRFRVLTMYKGMETDKKYTLEELGL